MVDVWISGGNGFYTFHTLNRNATDWVRSNVALPDYDRIAASRPTGVFHVDNSELSASIAQGMLIDGLTVALNGETLSLGAEGASRG